MPGYCPQQQIYRILAQKGTPSPVVFDRFRPPRGFSQLSVQSKQAAIVKAYREKMDWYQSCYDRFNDYDYLNRYVCNNMDHLGLADGDKSKLKALCKDCYCDYEPGDVKATMKSSEGVRQIPFCRRMARGAASTNQEPDTLTMGGPGTQLLQRTLWTMIVVVALILIFYSMLQTGHEMVANAEGGAGMSEGMVAKEINQVLGKLCAEMNPAP